MRKQSPKCKRPKDSIWAHKCYCIACVLWNKTEDELEADDCAPIVKEKGNVHKS